MPRNNEIREVVLLRVDSTQGYTTYSDVMDLVAKLKDCQISAYCEAAPGGIMDGISVFYIKVPENEYVDAKLALENLNLKS
jgi:hypothetical protein